MPHASMPGPRIGRRLLLGSAAAMAALPAAGQQASRLRVTWWGGADRARRTRAALDAWQRMNPGLTVDSETVGWGDYWTRLATQVGGGNAPDVIQMDYRYIHEYARRRALRPLDDMMPAHLNLHDVSADTLETGKVDGRLYGVPMGLNSTAMLFNTAVLERANIPAPTLATTWAQFAELATAITRAVGRRGFFGTSDGGLNEPALEVWVRGRGRLLYNEDGRIGFQRDDVAEWFDYWDKLRRAGGATPADIQALYRYTTETSMLTTNRSAIEFTHSNLLIAHQGLIQDRLGMTAYPRGDRPGSYYKPSMLLSVAATTPQAQGSAKLVEFLTMHPEAGEALGVERGVPPSATRRAMLAGTVPEQDRVQITFIEQLAQHVSPIPPPPPRGAGEMQTLLRRVNEQVAFGQLRVPQAADQFMTELARVLERA
jgi:multiple sugar transport system substrate-binding protein